MFKITELVAADKALDSDQCQFLAIPEAFPYLSDLGKGMVCLLESGIQALPQIN